MTKGGKMAGVAMVIVLLVAPSAATVATASVHDNVQASLSIKVMSTETNEVLEAVSTAGQPIEIEIRYSDLGEGDHEITILDDDLLSNDELVTTTVSGSSGSKTITVGSEAMAEFLSNQAETAVDLFAKSGNLESGKQVLSRTPQTALMKDVPDRVEPNQEVTVTVYGWSDKETAPVSLMEDDPPLRGDAGEDEQIRYKELTVEDNYYEETFTFVPSNYLTEGEDSDRILELDVRGDDPAPSAVKELAVDEPETTTSTTTTTSTITTTTATTSTTTDTTTPEVTTTAQDPETPSATTEAGTSDDITETTTTTATPTSTTTATPTSTTTSDDDVIQIEVPGFGMGIALMALVVSLLAARWKA